MPTSDVASMPPADAPRRKQSELLDACPECGRWRAPYLGAQILELVERVAELEAAIRRQRDVYGWVLTDDLTFLPYGATTRWAESVFIGEFRS